VVVDGSTCPVELGRHLLGFLQPASCGECTVCRIGTQRMLEILDRIRAGQGRPADLESLEDIATSNEAASLCGLGKSTAGPILATLRHFRDNYLEHIRDRRCRAGKCLFVTASTRST
jgi:NADH:ubiquinone oxidoreductase subunit F (NADH-binding)